MKRFLTFFFLLASILNAQGFLTPDEIAQFYQQGYLLKRQVLSREEMGLLKEEITAAVDRALAEIRQSQDLTFSEEDQMLYIDGSRVVCRRRPDQTVSIARINGCGGMQPSLLTTLRSDKMVRTFFELLGTADLEHLISQIHPKLPGDGIAFPRHRDIQFRKSFDPDWEDILGNGSYAICILPIEPMTPENGGMWVDRNNYPEPQGLEEDLVWIYAEPGDLLFMHPHLFHGSGPNNSPTDSRKTLLTGFCAFGANHKAYPGAFVNTRLTLIEDGSIAITPAPWSQSSSVGPGNGH
jgi:hypothetical protein